MKFCVDENIPLITVEELRRLGHDVLDIREAGQQGLIDDLLWADAQREQRILITTDKGFVSRRNDKHFGLMIVRLRQPNEHKIHNRVMQALHRFSEKDWPGFTVVMRDLAMSVWRSSSP
jgi:predicted nuclease of predicted toxin-antitoxin system